MTPLRQFKGVPPEIIRKAEGKQFVSVVKLSSRFATYPTFSAVVQILRLGKSVHFQVIQLY